MTHDWSPQDEAAMRIALDQAQNAWLAGEVPVGAVVVRRNAGQMQVIATGYNRPVTTFDPTAHAELVALRHAAQLLENYRLPECELFVTLEPCAMCAMALVHARFRRVVFGALDPKTGAAGSIFDVFGESRLNHQIMVQGGLMQEACSDLLREFFTRRRAEQKAQREGLILPCVDSQMPLIPSGEVLEMPYGPDGSSSDGSSPDGPDDFEAC